MKKLYDKVANIVLSFEGVKKKQSKNQTTFKDKYRSILHLRFDDEKLTIALARGAQLQKRYPFLEGNGSVVRHIYLHDISELDEGVLREIIKESMILNMEHYELKKLKGKL